MAETVNQEGTENNGFETVNQEGTFTQEELDKIVESRIYREKSKYADYEELKEKAARLDELEEASKTELQKALDKATKLQNELNGLKEAGKIREMRERVAKETGIPADMLTYNSEEECRKQAERIKDYKVNINPSYPNIRDGGEPGGSTNVSTAQQFAEWFNQQ